MPVRREVASRTGRVLAYLPFLILLAILAAVFWPQVGVGDTFFFWYAGHLVLTGGSPYDQNAWASAGATYGTFARNVVSTCTPSPYQPSCLWTYPPLTAFLFTPFALLNVRDGVTALSLALFMTTSASVVAVGHWMRTRVTRTRVLTLCACVVSHPFVFDINAGHFEGLGVLGIVLLAVGLTTRRTAPVVIAALLLSLKPHLYVGLAVIVVALLLARRDWRTLGWTFGAVAATHGLALLLFPEAPGAILWRAGQIRGVGWASTFAFASNLFPSALIGIVIVYSTAAFAFVVAVRFAPAERRIDTLVAAGAAVGLTLSPYAHPYDLLVLLPAFALALALHELVDPPARGILLVATAGSLAVGTWLAIAGSGVVTALPGALPPLVLALLGLAAWAAERRSAAVSRITDIATSARGSAGS